VSVLFEPIKIRDMEMRNRFVRSATFDSGADKAGYVTEQQIEFYQTLAAGGVGLIMTGPANVLPAGKFIDLTNGIFNDDFISGLKKLTAAVHDQGAKIAPQLYHAGRDSAKYWQGKDVKSISPSHVPNDPHISVYSNHDYYEATEDEIWEVIHAFGDAAVRAREAGFDAVQIHSAHACLALQFLSPHTNRRDDEWGGSLENRLRFHREIFRDIKAKAGEDYPVLMKLGVEDQFSGGLEFSEGKKAAQHLSEWGYDALEISSGLRGKFYGGTEFRDKINSLEKEAYFRDWAKEIKAVVNTPVMMVGGLRTFELMEEIIQKGEADFISLSRPLIREPNIINEWKNGNRHKSTCVSCNKCGVWSGVKLIRCRVNEKVN
jgi:2,4-dienoyl-CoA reductase-like NADH-dependent reductase (Old Yellow Enzyme family)